MKDILWRSLIPKLKTSRQELKDFPSIVQYLAQFQAIHIELLPLGDNIRDINVAIALIQELYSE